MTFFPKEGFNRKGFNEAPQVIKSYNSRLKNIDVPRNPYVTD